MPRRGDPEATKKKDICDILDFIKAKSTDVFCDLGCGNGKTVLWASEKVGFAYGIEKHKRTYLAAERNKKKRKRGNVEFINGDYIKHKTFNRVVKSNIIFCINEEPLSIYVMIEKTLKPNSFFITFGFPQYPIIPQSRLRNYYIMKTPFKIARNEHIWVRSVLTRNSKIGDVYRKMRRDFKPKFAKDDIEDLRELIISIKWLFEKLKCS